MQRNLLAELYDRDAGIAGDGSNPGASARGRYPEHQTVVLDAISVTRYYSNR